MSPRTKAQNEQIRQARKEQILTAARRIFAQHGFHNTKMSDIAQAAGVSQGTLYHYFSSKNDLFVALFFTWAEQLTEWVEGLPEMNLSAAEKLRRMNQVALAFVESDKELLPVMVEFWAYALRNPKAAAGFQDLFQQLQEPLRAIIDQGIASGEFKPMDAYVPSILPLIVLDGTILLTLIAGRDWVDPKQIMTQTLQITLDGLLNEKGKAGS